MSFRPPAPTSDRHVRWPAGFGQRFTIFVDTEEEFDWSQPFDRNNRAVTATAAIPAATRRFADMGASLTFLVDHPIATDRAAVAAIGEALAGGTAAVGSQLHPWVNPPFDEVVSVANSFPGNLPAGLEAAKMDALGTAITAAFGVSPRIYRAGRYGVGPNTWQLLAARGYAIDSSIRSRFDYSAQGGPDFSAIGNGAFLTGVDDLVALPLTTVDTGALRSIGAKLHGVARRVPRGTGVLARTGLLNRVALTPEGIAIAEAEEAIRVAVGEGLPLLNLSFHSPTLVAGHTPYARDAAGVATFWAWWEAVLALLARLDVRAVGEAELVAAVSTGQRGGDTASLVAARSALHSR